MIPPVFGGNGKPAENWVICDFPAIVYALRQMGVADPRVEAAIAKLESVVGQEYYPCCGSMPSFKGPGPRGGMCPYANLLAARALSVLPQDRGTVAAVRAGPRRRACT